MNIVLLGPPGAGKGTQAANITKRYNLPHISTGDILRRAAAENTDLGFKAKSFMDKGELVPDAVVIGIIQERLAEPDCSSGFLLDGFPRTVPQAVALDGVLAESGKNLDVVLNIAVDRGELVKRLTGRRSCKKCGRAYHLVFDPPKKENICDDCDGELYQREDDSEETVLNRMKVYDQRTEPLIAYYEHLGKLESIDGSRPIEEVFSQIDRLIGAYK